MHGSAAGFDGRSVRIVDVAEEAANRSEGNEPSGTETGPFRARWQDWALSSPIRRRYATNVLTVESGREMPDRTLARRLFDELAQRLAPRSVRQTSDPPSAEIPSALPDAGNPRTTAPGPTVGSLLYLGSLGIVATATAGVFFGTAFLLLAHPREEIIAGAREVELPRSDLFSLPDTDALLAAASTRPVPSAEALEAHEALPSAGAIPGASGREMSPSAEATLAPPAGIDAKRAGVGRHRYEGSRRHWAAGSRPRAIGRWPPPVSGPEQAWRWIVRSANNVLVALSPPPTWQGSGLKTR
jgi:hypothetical protein